MDENSQIDGKPFPKNSKIKEEDNEPRESMDNQNEQSQENNINNDDNNFPEAPSNYNENENADFDKYNGENNNNNNNGENNENEEYNNDFNNDNNFKDDDNDNNNNNNNDNKNNDGSVRFSNLTDNNRYSSANNENDNQKNENNFDFVNDNNNNNNNNNNNDFGENDNNNNNYNDNFGFNESDMKENDNNFNDFNQNQNQQNDNNFNNNNDKNTNIRGSGNSEHLQINENNNNNMNNKNNQENNNNYNNNQNNSILRNRNNNNNFNNNNNNFNNNNRNNNFNYASNPYNSNNNNNQNGGQNYNTNVTSAQFIPQDNHVMNNLNYNYNYSSNYGGGGSNQVRHEDYHSYYGRFEELPEDTDGFHIDPQENGTFSSTLAGIHIANLLMGAELLSAPIIMSYLGLLVGIIFYIFMAIITLYSVYILMRCHEITGKSGYSMLAKVTLGKVGNIIVKIILIIQGFGLCGAYLRIFGECLQTLFQAFISKGSYLVEDSQVYLFILFGGLIMIIFVAVKKISNMKRLTYLGIIIALVICIAISILLFYKGVGNYLDSDISWDLLFPDCSFSDAFQSSSTIFAAFLIQANVFPVYYSLNNRSSNSMMRATKIGVSLSLVLFFIFGIIGLFLYGFDIDDTILENFYEDMGDYQDNNAFIVILLIFISIFFILLSLTSFPILFKSLMVNFVNSIIICTKGCRRFSGEQDVQISQSSSNKKRNYINKKVYSIITILSYILIVVFAILIYRIQTFLTIVGATAGIFFIFILPNLFYLLIIRQTGKKYNTCLPLALVGFGVFFFVVTLISTFL